MFCRLLRFRSVTAGQAFQRRFKGGWVDGGDHATHNDLPVPEGDWRVQQSRLNMRNNLTLLSGILALAGAIYLIGFSGTIFFNASPPCHWKPDEAEKNEDKEKDKEEEC